MSETKKGHPIVAVVLGILGIAAAIFLAFLTGMLGGIIAGVLGLLAIILGIGARKGGRGIAPIILGVLAILMAFILAAVGIGAMTALREKALENSEQYPLMTKYTENVNMGFLSVIMNASKDDVNVEALAEELKALTSDESGAAATATTAPETTEAPAQEGTETTETAASEAAETTNEETAETDAQGNN